MRTRRPPSVTAALIVVALTGASLVASTPLAGADPGDLDDTFATAGQAFVDLSTGVGEAAGVAAQPDGLVVSVSTVGPAADPGSAADVLVERRHADGTPDTAFGSGGATIVDVDGTRDEAAAVAIDAAGRIVVVGTTRTRWHGDAAFVARLLPTGALDPDFGAATEAGGVVVLPRGVPGIEAAHALVLQPDGRIVVGGESAGEHRVLRLTDDGSLDGGFGDGGVAYPGGWSGRERVRALALQPDGAIVGAGPSGEDLGVFRLLPDGRLDEGFGEYGMARTNLGEGTVEDAAAVVVRPDGTIAVAGRVDNSLLVLRHTADGDVDESFASGHVREHLGEGGGEAFAITAVGDRVVVGGRYGDAGALLAYEADGERVAGYGDGGHARTGVDVVTALAPTPDGGLALTGPHGDRAATELVDAAGAGRGPVVAVSADATADELAALAVAGNGDVVLAGHAATGSGWDFAAARLGPGGSTNGSFDGGSVTVDIGGADRAHAVAILDDGGVVLAGDTASWWTDIALVRLTPVGTRDPAFGGDGVVTASLTDGDEGARAVAAAPGGGVVVAGFADNAMAVLRVLPDGTLDPAFGDGGVVRLAVREAWTQATAVAVEPDGSVWVAGETAENQIGVSATEPDDRFDGDRDAVVAKLLPDGTPDPAFGDAGTTVVDVASGDDRVTGIALDGAGRAHVATTSFRPGSGERDPIAGVVRVRADGTLDPGFGPGGVVRSDELSGVPPLAGTVGVAVAPDGDVVLASRAGAVEVLRLDADGTPDGDHGDGGMTWTGFGSAHDEPRALAARPDGSVLVGGLARDPGATSFAVVPVTATGGADESFAGGGALRRTIAGTTDALRGVAALPDGGVVAVGESRVGPAGDVALVRLLPDGTPDPAFGRDGVLLTDVSDGHDGAHAVAVQPDGRLVVAGFAGHDLLIARYEPWGGPDWYFGEAGIVTVDLADGSEDEARAVAVQPDGAIVVAGHALFRGDAQRFPSIDAAVVRVTADGVLDESFGDGGVVTTDLDGGDERAFALAAQPDGSLVVAGSRDDRALLLRHAPDGGLDPAFGDGAGAVVLDDVPAGATGVATQPDGTVAVAAAVGDEVVVTRVEPSGAIAGPATRVPLGGPVRTGGALVQPDGAIVVAASVAAGSAGTPDAALVRLRVDGVPDPRFGDDGVARTGGAADTADGIAIAPDGALLLTGASERDGTIARVLGGEAGPVSRPADLAVTITADPASVLVGEPLRHAVRVRNDGPGPADAVVVRAVIDGGATVLGTTAGQGEPCVETEPPPPTTTPTTTSPPTTPPTTTPPTETPPTETWTPTDTWTPAAEPTTAEPTPPVATADAVELTCGLGSLAPGDTVNLTITVQPTRPGTVTATVRVSSDQEDPDDADDTASVVTVVSEPPVVVTRVPEVRVNPGVVRLGRVVAVTASGLEPGLAVTIGQDGDLSTRTAVVGRDGVATAQLVVFAETTPGSRDVEIRGPDGAVLAATRLLVTVDSGSPPDFVARG